MSYLKGGRLTDNDYITDADVPDPENLPQPLGWTLKVRPYKIETKTRGGIILAADDINYLNTVVNVGRVMAIGPCCWSRSYHLNKNGESFNWVNVGDFVSYPKHVGTTRKFKGVSIVTLGDEEIDEYLPDPLIFAEDSHYRINIPKDHLEKYSTVYNPNYPKKKD